MSLGQAKVLKLCAQVTAEKASLRGCNELEKEFLRRASGKGLTILRHGWPDFLCTGKDGKPYCVEVKAGRDVLSPAQVAVATALESIGIPCYVWSSRLRSSLIPWRKFVSNPPKRCSLPRKQRSDLKKELNRRYCQENSEHGQETPTE